jgi:hypothetical protein
MIWTCVVRAGWSASAAYVTRWAQWARFSDRDRAISFSREGLSRRRRAERSERRMLARRVRAVSTDVLCRRLAGYRRRTGDRRAALRGGATAVRRRRDGRPAHAGRASTESLDRHGEPGTRRPTPCSSRRTRQTRARRQRGHERGPDLSASRRESPCGCVPRVHRQRREVPASSRDSPDA